MSNGGQTTYSDGGITMYIDDAALNFAVTENKVQHLIWRATGIGNCIDIWCNVAAVWHFVTGLQVSFHLQGQRSLSHGVAFQLESLTRNFNLNLTRYFL